MVVRASVLIRLGGLAAAAGGVLWSLLWLMDMGTAVFLRGLGITIGNMAALDNVVYVLLLLGIIVGVAALHALQREHYGFLGTLASLIAFVGAALLTYGVSGRSGDLLFYLGLLLTTVGLVALGIVTTGAGVLPKWCGVSILVGSPLFVLIGTVFLGLLGPAAMQPVGVAWMLVGYAIFRAGSHLPERPARVR